MKLTSEEILRLAHDEPDTILTYNIPFSREPIEKTAYDFINSVVLGYMDCGNMYVSVKKTKVNPGDRVGRTDSDLEYIVAVTGVSTLGRHACLICLATGNRWSEPTPVHFPVALHHLTGLRDNDDFVILTDE